MPFRHTVMAEASRCSLASCCCFYHAVAIVVFYLKYDSEWNILQAKTKEKLWCCCENSVWCVHSDKTNEPTASVKGLL